MKTVAGGWQRSDFDSNNTVAKTNISSTIANWISNSNTYSFLSLVLVSTITVVGTV